MRVFTDNRRNQLTTREFPLPAGKLFTGQHEWESDRVQRSAARTFRVVIQINSDTQPMDATTLATGHAE